MAENVDIVVRNLRGVTAGVTKRLALAITAELIRTTPVDTGHARNNWIPAIDRPNQVVAGEPDNPSANLQERAVASIASAARLRSVFVTNNVPYIQFLNGGSSRQAPAGFVQAAILTALRNVERAGSVGGGGALRDPLTGRFVGRG